MRIGPPFPKFTVAVIYDAGDSSLLFQKLIVETEDHFRYWHKTDIESLPLNFRFRGNSGHVLLPFHECTPYFAAKNFRNSA
jgi:hypothetical protein